jgi:LysM repeat protein
VVKPGENLFRIALRYNTTIEALAQANGITNPSLIYVGQRLVVPGTGAPQPQPGTDDLVHVVQPGENLFRIALKYNYDYLYLARYNNISNPSRVYVGQKIYIPRP